MACLQKIYFEKQIIPYVELFPNYIHSCVLSKKGRYHCQLDWWNKKGLGEQKCHLPLLAYYLSILKCMNHFFNQRYHYVESFKMFSPLLQYQKTEIQHLNILKQLIDFFYHKIANTVKMCPILQYIFLGAFKVLKKLSSFFNF